MDVQTEINRLIAEGISTGFFTLLNGRIVKLKDSDILRLMQMLKSYNKSSAPISMAQLVPNDLFVGNQQMIPDIRGIDFDQLEQQINKKIYEGEDLAD